MFRRNFVQNTIAGFIAATFGPSLSKSHGVVPLKKDLNIPDSLKQWHEKESKFWDGTLKIDPAYTIPVRQNITFLPADNPKELRLGWRFYELAGWAECNGEVANIDTGEIYSSIGWTDFDWEIYNLSVHNSYSERKTTNRNKIKMLLNKLKNNPKDFSFVEMQFFIQDKGKCNCYWEYEGEKKHHSLFNNWLKYVGLQEAFVNSHSIITTFPQHEINNNIQCKIHMMEKSLEFLLEQDPNGYLGCYFNIVKNDEEHKLHCYDVIKEESETVDEKTMQWFAVYGRTPNLKETKELRKGFDVEAYHEAYQKRLEGKKTLPSKWKPYLYGRVIINDYTPGKVTINND